MNVKITDAEFFRLVNFMHSNYGIDLSKKRVLIEGRLSNLLTERNFTSYTQYLDSVMNDKSGAELTVLVNKLTTNHTYFMRESQHFEYLKSTVLPYIEKTVTDKDARIWCAASSSGEEPYTIAMTIDEYFGSRKAGWDLRILATDISTNVLKRASNGIYSAESVSSLPVAWQKKYFNRQSDGSYKICDEIRRQVIFKQFNLMNKIVYKKPFDIIFCRNVMIYFDNETKQNLIKRFYDATKKGGYLFIGHAENIPKDSEYKFIHSAIYRK